MSGRGKKAVKEVQDDEMVQAGVESQRLQDLAMEHGVSGQLQCDLRVAGGLLAEDLHHQCYAGYVAHSAYCGHAPASHLR